MNKYIKRLSLILAVILLIPPACAGPSRDSGRSDGGTAVIDAIVTFDALYELAAAIGGDRVRVINIMPPNAEAHHFEPSAKDLTLLNTAAVFIVCGLGFEPWAESALGAAGNEGLTLCVASRGIEPITLSDDELENHDHGGSGHDLSGGQFDPHIWLSLPCAVVMAENIKDSFIEADPGGADYYKQAFNEFARSADGLFKEYSVKFDGLKNKTIVTGHAVFGYLCRDFGLEQNSVEGVFAEGEPSARALAELIDFCRARNITSILTETLSSPLIAETLASEAGAQVIAIYTMESAEDNLAYLARMEYNLAVIYESLRR